MGHLANDGDVNSLGDAIAEKDQRQYQHQHQQQILQRQAQTADNGSLAFHDENASSSAVEPLDITEEEYEDFALQREQALLAAKEFRRRS